jgi:hypothetical protein
MYNQDEFIAAAELSYRAIDREINSKKRSPIRLKAIQDQILANLRDSFGPNASAEDAHLQPVDGLYHRKNFPIVVKRNDEPVLCIGTTFTLGGYESNIINYFQSILGESVNLQMSGKNYASIQIIPTQIKRTNNGNVTYDDIKPSNFRKFYELLGSEHQAFTPMALGCQIVAIDYDQKTLEAVNPANIFEGEDLVHFQDFLSMEQFFDKIENFCRNL